MADKTTAQDDIKKRARRRLVGAAALALAAAIILPMVMDAEPKPGAPDIQIRIPSPDEAAPPLRARPAAPEPAAKPESAVPAEAKPETAPTPPQAPPAARPDADAKPAATPKTESKPESKAEKPKNEAAQVQALLDGRNEAAAGQFMVQLGVFADPENARKVQARVKTEGYNAFADTVKSGEVTKTRVRAGPFDSREAADKARAKLERAGLKGIVAPRQ